MSSSLNQAGAFPRRTAALLGAALAVAVAVGIGLLVVELLLAPAPAEMRNLAAYFILAGGLTLGVGWLVLQLVDRALGLSIQARSFISAVISSAVALINVFIVAQFMFISTSHDLKLLFALIVFSGVVTVFFSLWVAAAVTSRIAMVAAGVRTLAAGDYAALVQVSGEDEVALLGRNVNLLARRLKAAEEQRSALDRERQELTAAISHDLRTPLASVRAMVEALDDQVVAEPAEVKRYYVTIQREIERLNSMIDDMFELARMDAGARDLMKQPLHLQDIAADVIDSMQAQAHREGVMLTLVLDSDPGAVELDGSRVERAIANLVRNALEHTRAGGHIDVRVFAEEGWGGLSVTDDGEGIAPADLSRIWERFYRAERSRARASSAGDGAGLGLAVVRSFVEAHGGTVEVSSAVGKATVFTIRLPAPVSR